MTQGAPQILAELQRRGVIVAVEGDTLCLKPKRALDGPQESAISSAAALAEQRRIGDGSAVRRVVVHVPRSQQTFSARMG